jgi:hypothetical protein
LNSVTLAKVYKVIGETFPPVGKVPPGPLAGLVAMVSKKLAQDAPVEDWQERSELLKELDAVFLKVGKETARTAGSSKVATVFGEFADLAAEDAFDAWTKTMQRGV